MTIGSLDDPEQAPIVSQCGMESRISWVKFCEDVPGENTVSDQAAESFFAGMKNNQG